MENVNQIHLRIQNAERVEFHATWNTPYAQAVMQPIPLNALQLDAFLLLACPAVL